jgi:hypothetical protein
MCVCWTLSGRVLWKVVGRVVAGLRVVWKIVGRVVAGCCPARTRGGRWTRGCWTLSGRVLWKIAGCVIAGCCQV